MFKKSMLRAFASLVLCVGGVGGVGGALAESAHSAQEIQQDIQRHRALALAHERAAQCLSAGTDPKRCMADLQTACKGLAIGKYCGLRHVH